MPVVIIHPLLSHDKPPSLPFFPFPLYRWSGMMKSVTHKHFAGDVLLTPPLPHKKVCVWQNAIKGPL